jgi:hypothetical protein
MLETNVRGMQITTKEFINYSNLAPLATADYVNPMVQSVKAQIGSPIDFKSPDSQNQINEKINALNQLMQQLQVAGRRDLWNTSEVPSAEVAKES